MFMRTDSEITALRRRLYAGLAALAVAGMLVVPAEVLAAPSGEPGPPRPYAGGHEEAAATVVARVTSIYWSLYPSIATPRLRRGVQEQAPQGEIVREIKVDGNTTLEDETVKFFLSFVEGDVFDWATAQQDFRTMLNSEFFDDLQMGWERIEGGVRITIDVIERPILRDIRFEGTEKGDKDALLERMELLEMPIVLDQPIDRRRMLRAGEVLTTMLQGDEGLQFVQVTYSESRPLDGSSGVDAVFDVVEGDTVRIENVYFDGVTEFTQQELRWMTKKTSEHWLMSFLVKNDRYSPAGFEFDQLNLSNEYRRLGYIDIAIGTPEVEVYDINRPWPMGDTRRLYVVIPINEGPQYRLGDIIIEGNTRFTDEQLSSLVPLAKGDILDVKGLVDATEAMENNYSNFGYFQVVVFPVPVPDPETGIADVEYVITENALYRVRRIEFEGNTNTRDYVMRRNLRISENDLWSQARVEASKFRIQQLGYFDMIEEVVTIVDDSSGLGLAPGEEFDPSQPQAGAPDVGEVDITLKVSEVGRNQISFGGGVSALEGAFVQLGYATRNLFGRGQTFSFSGQFGGRTTTARLSFLQPYLFGKNIRGGIDIFRSKLDYIDFQQQSSGISFRVGFPLDRGEFTTLFLEYNFSNIDIGELNTSFFGLSDPIFQALFLTSGKRTTSSVRPNIVYNSINNPFNPSQGRRHTASFEFAGGPLGGTLNFFKSFIATTMYIPTKVEGRGVGAMVSQIFAFNVQLRMVEPYGDLITVPIFERFFLGGSNSVRGTQLRAIGPVDQFGNIIGGTRALQYNIEYIFALANPLRIAVFHDAGAAWDDEFSLPLSELRKTAGVEFRIFMPVFNVPFRFFWAYNFDPLPQFGEERSSFEFAIGTTF